MNLPQAHHAANFNPTLIIFEEDDATICYCPALAGYSATEEDATFVYGIARALPGARRVAPSDW